MKRICFLTLKVRMSCTSDIMPTSLAVAVVCHTGKIIKQGKIIKHCLDVFERGENLLQNGILHCV